MLIAACCRLTRCLPGRRLVAAAAAAVAVALPLAAAAPAQADQVRQREMWVLNMVQAPGAWRVTQGKGVLVAVIDSGVDPNISDLKGSVTTGPDLTGVGTPMSNANWGAHGTWMASLIAGHGHGRGDGSGIIGVAPRARILSIRVITDRSDPGNRKYERQSAGRGQRELAAAIRYAVDKGAAVISMSLGYTMPSLVVRAALQYAINHNAVVVASAGNLGDAQIAQGHGHAPYSFPADYPGVIGVAAINAAGQPANFSSGNFSVQVAAPGVNVPAAGRRNRYWLVSGTSPACALTAGVAALVRAKYPKLTAAQVRLAIVHSASHSPPGRYNDEVGFGTVNAVGALAAAARLARQAPAGNSAAAVAAASGYFGGGPHAVPRVPVPPRGTIPVRYLYGAAAASLLLLLLSLWRLAGGLASRRSARRNAVFMPSVPGAVPAFAGMTADPRYARPGPGYPGAVPPAQQWLNQQWAGQPQPGQVPVMPGQVPTMPGQVPTMPGQVPVMPAQVPVVPDQVPAMPVQPVQPVVVSPGPQPAIPHVPRPPVAAPNTSPAEKPAREPRTRPWRRQESADGQTAAGQKAAGQAAPEPAVGRPEAAPVTRPDIPVLGQPGGPERTLPKRVRPADREQADGQQGWDPWSSAGSPAQSGTDETAT